MMLAACLKIIRPHQWLKNLMLFFPPFLAGVSFQAGMLADGLVAISAFSLASSTAYIFNDLIDIENDRQHPVKANRPLAAGYMNRTFAVSFMLVLLLGSLLLSNLISTLFFYLVSLYLLISALYSLLLKDWPLLDIFCISTGFVLRLYAGGEAFGVVISDWLFLSVFLLALFLSLGKRCSEQMQLGADAHKHRKVLGGYPDGFLESCMPFAGGAVLVTYSIYSISTPHLVYTVPLCMFGLLRYLMRMREGRSGDPTEALIKDPLLMMTGIIWVIMVGWSIY